MTKRLPCPPAPGPLEDYAAQFDPLFGSLAQRRGLRAYLQGLLLPRDRNKTLTALAGAEPVVGAQHAAVQGLQFFLSESTWDHEQLNQRRLELLGDDPATRPHDQGVLVIDDSGDRKDGTKTAHVARQYLGSVGKTDNGIVAVTSLWADERVYWPVHVVPYTPACRLPKGKRDPGFRTKPQQAVELVQAARTAGISFRAVVADCFYGDNEGFCAALGAAKVAYVLAVKPRKGVWAPADEVHTPQEAARQLAWAGPAEPGDWTPVTRRFRDGHTETWWAADAALPAAGWGPDRRLRLVVATTDPATLPKLSTWYLVTNLPRPGRRRTRAPFPPADLAEVVRLYGLRNWVEQGYKQVKHELGWADFQVRSDRAIRRHWQLVCCAFCFCWRAWFAERAVSASQPDAQPAPAGARGEQTRRHGRQARHRRVAGDAAPGPGLADPVGRARTLLAGVVDQAPASPAWDAA
jgi:DDE superfamily endonuclease